MNALAETQNAMRLGEINRARHPEVLEENRRIYVRKEAIQRLIRKGFEPCNQILRRALALLRMT